MASNCNSLITNNSLSCIISVVIQVSWWATELKAKTEYICRARFSGRKGECDSVISARTRTYHCSICSPSVDVQVGVGTCNIGGKGMTDFVSPVTKPSSRL